MKNSLLVGLSKTRAVLSVILTLGSPLLLLGFPCLAGDSELLRSVVKIFGSSAPGSGVVVRSEPNKSIILTARHVIDNTNISDKPYIQTKDGEKYDVISIHPILNLDLAELVVATFLPMVRLSTSKHGGGIIRLIGFPQESTKSVLSSGPSEAQGGFSSHRPGGYQLIHGAPSTIGMSGGGVFNHHDELIGIHGQADTTELLSGRIVKTGYSLAVPIQLWLSSTTDSDNLVTTAGPQDLLARASYLRSSFKLDQSLEVVSQALVIEPNSFTLLIFRASLYIDMNQPKLALLDLDLAAALPNYSGHASIHSNRGTALLMLKDYERALSAYNAAIEAAPRLVDLHINKSKALQKLGRISDSVLSLNHALSLDAYSLNALIERAGLLRTMHRYKEALADLDVYLSLKEDDPVALTLAGALHGALQNYQESYEYFRKAHAITPGDPNSSINLAVALASNGDKTAALDMLRVVISKNPNNNVALANLSEILFSTGEVRHACENAGRASQNGFTWNANEWDPRFVNACGIALDR
jgi:tetratricopeptide (TPR) repeat protein